MRGKNLDALKIGACIALPILTVVILSDLGASRGIFNYREGGQVAEENNRANYCNSVARAFRQHVITSPSSSDGQANPYKNDYDSCQQWRSADATDRSAFWAGVQGIFTALGFVFVVVATVAAGLAACFAWKQANIAGGQLKVAQDAIDETKKANKVALMHAERSATAALEAVAISARDSRLRYKPWIIVDVVGPFVPIDASGDQNPLRRFNEGERNERLLLLHGRVHITCIGDVPATIEKVGLRIEKGAFGSGSEAETFVVLRPREEIIINPRYGDMEKLPRPHSDITQIPHSFADYWLTRENRSDFMRHPPPVLGSVIFADPFGRRYCQHFCFVATARAKNFERHGGHAANYEVELPASAGS